MPSSLYFGFLLQNIKTKYLKTVDSRDLGEYEFITYQTDNNCTFYTITINEISTTTFIIDYEGGLYRTLQKRFDPKYQPVYYKQTCQINFNKSLMDDTFMNSNYFSRESENDWVEK